MRRLLAGIFLLTLLIPGAAALAETKGEVQSLGFQWHYRPNCHVPMLVRVEADKSGTYQIQVIQEDLDRDQQVFVETVSLTGADEGGAADQRFWLYFIPQPVNGGLNGLSLRELQQTLKVFLCDENGRQICQLPVTQTAISVDHVQAGPYATGRGTKLIIAVSDTAAQPIWRDYQYAIGTLEDVIFVTVRSSELPEDVRGYEGIDGLVWLSAPAPDAAKPAEEKRYHAIREYVRSGGHLVVCQPAQREATAGWDDLLPVTVREVAPRATLEPLRTLARADERKPEAEAAQDPFAAEERKGPGTLDWDLPRGPFMFARAELKPRAVADEEFLLAWDGAGNGAAGDVSATATATATPTTAAAAVENTPYIARIGYGAGCVTWVAHDLADPVIVTRAKSGWPFVWDRVLAYNDDPLIVDQRTEEEEKKPYAQAAGYVDIGHSLLGGMELTAKRNALVAIAIVFFIAYWVVAGPGVYLWLVTRTRSQLSWFMFALSALVATALTVLVVKLVVRGPPQMQHVTVVRAAAGEPAISLAQFGLYIPRDGSEALSLPEVAPKHVSYITGFPAHPSNTQGEMDFPARERYLVPLREANSDEPVAINVPYRSTLKKFQARRVGAIAGIVDGRAKLRRTDFGTAEIEGIITNGTGRRLRNVYIAFSNPLAAGGGGDTVFYEPRWEPGASLDLAKDFTFQKAKTVTSPDSLKGDNTNRNVGYPAEGIRLRGRILPTDVDWTLYWFALLRGKVSSFSNAQLSKEDVESSFPLMSLFSRLPPMRAAMDSKKPGLTRGDAMRAELLRRGARHLDVSSAVAAGRLVILAQAEEDAELPFPLEVEGDRVDGKGTLFYQFILPIDQPPLEQPAATPTTTPATQPAATQRTTASAR